MVLPIVKYGHPALRQRGATVTVVTPEIRQLIADMLETMLAARGVGLAAQQVAQALQVAVIDVRGVTDRPSTLLVAGQPTSPEALMPLVLLNPVVTPINAAVIGPEGCLSFPELYADISRPESVDVEALNEHGQTVRFRCGGLLARAIQHELDHLRGVLFIDRMSRARKEELREELDELQAETKAGLAKLAR